MPWRTQRCIIRNPRRLANRARARVPFKRMVIRGVTLIDGTGSPPVGPVDIVVENDKIARIVGVGVPNIAHQGNRVVPRKGDFEIDATGSRTCCRGSSILTRTLPMRIRATWAESAAGGIRLQAMRMGHGITTVREAGSVQRLALDPMEEAASERGA